MNEPIAPPIGNYRQEEAQTNRGRYILQRPIQNGFITDFEVMEKLWNHTFYEELKVSPEQHYVLLTEPPFNSKSNREKMMQIMLEKYQTVGTYLANQGLLSLYANGKTTGIALCSGYQTTFATPVYHGHYLPHASYKINFGGNDITEHLTTLFYERGHSFTTVAEKEIVRDVKEKLCYISENYEKQREQDKLSELLESNYELPDGQVITIGDERYRSAEAVFQPTLAQKEFVGVHELVYDSVMKCDEDIRKDMFQNIVISGGNTRFPGFQERMEKELVNLVPTSAKINVIAPLFRSYAVWIGGAVLGSLSSFYPMVVTRKEYDEEGPSVVHRKCF